MIDVFCDVIDNYGDAGVCIRLCRDLSKKNFLVNLYCNNTNTVQKILNVNDNKNPLLNIYQWDGLIDNYTPSKVVIQAFSVRLDKTLIDKIKESKSLVINLEYLTAETFAEDCHTLPSYSDGIQSYFFFPGFTSKTGGVLIEDEFLSKIRKATDIQSSTVSLFGYENPKVQPLLDKISKIQDSIDLIVFEGRPLNNFNSIYSTNLQVGQSTSINNIHVEAKGMVSQDEYDDILLSSCINLVRGEDSIVRAMLVGKPFLWHIYPQEEDAHKDKINALFDRMDEIIEDKESVLKLRNLTLSYNGFSDYIDTIDLKEFYTDWLKISQEWSEHLISIGSLSTNLINFIKHKS